MNIEPLESRIAPAGFTHTYTDVDGDLVSIAFSQGTEAQAAFDEQPSTGPLAGSAQLRSINLNGDQDFKGVNITITAKPQLIGGSLRGDGLANVGFIDASGGGGIDLGAVKIAGDLGRILAGDGTLLTPGLASLSVLTMGVFGTDTQAAGGDLNSVIKGQLGSLLVKGDVLNAFISAGSIGAVTIGGSLIGSTTTDSGSILAAGDIGLVKIGRDLISGPGADTGEIKSTGGTIAGVTIGGSVPLGGKISSSGDLGPVTITLGAFGGLTIESTSGKIASVTSREFGGVTITSAGDIGAVKIGFDSNASITSMNGKLASLTVGGDFTSSPVIIQGDIGPVKIAGDIAGATIKSSGGNVAGVSIGGSLDGGVDPETGFISSAGAMGMITIGGDVAGSSVDDTGSIRSGDTLAGVTIGGSLRGGTGARTGEIFSALDMGPVKIGGDLQGGLSNLAFDSGYIHTGGGKIASVTIGGDMLGGAATNTGAIFTTGALGPVMIGDDLRALASAQSGLIDGGSIASVSIGGSMFGTNKDLSGVIFSLGNIGAVKIGGDLFGGSLSAGASTVDRSGYIQGERIASVFIGGSINTGRDSSAAGSLTKNASIRAEIDIGSITVRGSLDGAAHDDGEPADGDFTPVIISAGGGLSATAKKDVAIKTLTIGGSVERADIRAGFDVALAGKNADAQIGKVSVGGNWKASTLVAGVEFDTGGFGDGDDAKIAGAGVKDNADLGGKGTISKIASVIIGGHAFGTLASNDAEVFGIEAQQLGSIKLGGAAVALTKGAGNDLFGQRHALGPTLGISPSLGSFDFHAFEVAVAP